MKIVTLTLNPAFDIHCHTPNFQPFHENLAHITAIDAGGKGINISRALTNMGVENTALVVLGEENADSFRRSLTADNIQFCEISVGGRIRENITLHTENTPETRISFAGFTVDDTLLKAVEQRLNELIDGNAILTVTGRNLEGLSMDALKDMLIRFRKKGVKLIVDSRSFSLQDLLDVRPWLIKPNEEEIGMYTDMAVKDLHGAKAATDELRGKGIENVMISLGSQGAILCCAEGSYVANAPRIKVLSTIGAGDSSIGGFCAAAKAGQHFSEMLRYAVAYGSAACMTEGTRPPEAASVEALLHRIRVTKI